MKKSELEEILKYTICKKGCGEVEIENAGYGPICSYCGEELENELTSAHCSYIMNNIKVRKEDDEF